MKKILSLFIAFVLICSLSSSIQTYAKDNVIDEWQDIYLNKIEFEEIVMEKENAEKASTLIVAYSVGVKKSGNNLIIAGSTICNPDVIKCGYKELVIQRRIDSSSPWVDYVTYEDLYDDSPSYVLSKSITVGTGYQYRVTAIHYAKKNIFSTQKINNTSNTVVFA